MAKTGRSNARARAEQARLARERAARRARRVRTAWWAIAAGPAFVVLLVLIKVAIPEPSPGGGGGAFTGDLSAAAIAALSPDPSTLDSTGRGQGVTPANRIENQPALTDGGKPLVLYVGAEFCPFCASQRWPLVIALNRFGTFTGLTASHSASDDTFPDTATVSFHGSSYVSEFLAFQGVETATNERGADGRYEPLDQLTPEQEAVFNTYNSPPYVPRAGSIPFLDIGNRFLQTGTSMSPELLAGLSHDQIAAELTNNPTGPIGQAILGSANAFTAALCVLTNGRPGEVCTSPAVTAYQSEVGGG